MDATPDTPTYTALGLMSGTSLDGIDAALIRTDGLFQVTPLGFRATDYDPEFRRSLRGVLGGKGATAQVERALTLLHAATVHELLAESGLSPSDVDVIGFHGHTILHEPEKRRTWQIGDGALLARETAIDVVSDLRSNDMRLGGEGAPLASLFHLARAAGLGAPLAVLNIGGVSNATWIGGGEGEAIAFDCGPGNALINDWVEQHTGELLDRDGKLGRQGRVQGQVLAELLDNDYFERAAPKSLDRDDFDAAPVAGLSLEDGAATLTAFTAAAIELGLAQMPEAPRRWLVTGGGRKNPTLMAALAERLGTPVEPVEAVGWNGDALEAEAFAYLAVRSLAGQPLSLPSTTGVSRPATGGQLHRHSQPDSKAS
jgi:anhydro-N-acetylmuramic acid kinase